MDKLIDEWKSNTVEFKVTLKTRISEDSRRDLDTTEQVIEAIAGFLNADGGTVVVEDDGMPVGIEIDDFPSEDNVSVRLDNILTDRINQIVVSNNIRTNFRDYQGVRALIVQCTPYMDRVNVKGRKPERRDRRNNIPHFYVRREFSTMKLHGVEISKHLEERRRRIG